jgi:actin related protein 2/3 complex subunit 2
MKVRQHGPLSFFIVLFRFPVEAREAFVKSLSFFKRNALAAPFELAFKAQKSLDTSGSRQGDLMQINYRDEEAIYVQPSHDRVTVIFSTIFREETDRIFGKVFLQVRSMHRASVPCTQSR